MRGDQPGGPIRWRIHVGAPPAKVYAALDSDSGRAAFWAESASEIDGLIHFRFINGYQCSSRILRREPCSLFELDYIGGRASFELSDDGDGGTDLLLTHHDMSKEAWNEVHAGWLNVLFPLKVWVMHGIDIRNHDPQRSWDHGYADQ